MRLKTSLAGARQLLWGDVHSAAPNFKPFYDFLAEDMVLARERSQLSTLPQPSWVALLSAVAAFMPFYYSTEVVHGNSSKLVEPSHLLAFLLEVSVTSSDGVALSALMALL